MSGIVQRHRRAVAVFALLTMVLTYIATVLPAASLDPGAAASAGLPGSIDVTDGDTLGDGEEVRGGTSPSDSDTDNDGLDDGYEIAQGLDPTDGSDCPEWICGGGLKGWRLQLLRQN